MPEFSASTTTSSNIVVNFEAQHLVLDPMYLQVFGHFSPQHVQWANHDSYGEASTSNVLHFGDMVLGHSTSSSTSTS